MDSGPDTIEEFGKNLASFVSGFLSGVIRHVVRECMREARGSDPRWGIDFTPPTDPEYVLGEANRHISQDDHLEELRDPDGVGHPILDVSRSIPLPEHPYGKQGTELGKTQHKLDVAQGMLRQDVGQVKAMLEGLKERMRVYEREQERLGYKDIEMLQKRDGGWGVKREHGKGYFSRKPQSKEKAMAQLRVIEAAKHGKHYSEMDGEESDGGGEGMERSGYCGGGEDCGCGCSEPKPARRPYRLARVAGGRIRVEYNESGGDNVMDPPATPAEARQQLKRHAMCSTERDV